MLRAVNVFINGNSCGAFSRCEVEVSNFVDNLGRKQGCTGPVRLQACRDAAQPIIDLLKAYVGRKGNCVPITKLSFELEDSTGKVIRRWSLYNVILTAWAMDCPIQPNNPKAPRLVDHEAFTCEATYADCDNVKFQILDPNAQN